MAASDISTVSSQTGRKLKIVNYTALAWEQIQTAHRTWRWMRTEFTFAMTAPTQRYSGSDMSLTRWSRWVFDPRRENWSGFSNYLTATGVSDEQPMLFMDWMSFRRRFLFGTQTADRPSFFTIDNAGQFTLGPYPAADYTLVGEYQKSPQTLTANSDEPECPAENHDVIVWWALMLLAEHDEAIIQDPWWRLQRSAEYQKLMLSQLDPIEMGPGSVLA